MNEEIVNMLRPNFPLLSMMTYKGIEKSGYSIEIHHYFCHIEDKMKKESSVTTPEGEKHYL